MRLALPLAAVLVAFIGGIVIASSGGHAGDGRRAGCALGVDLLVRNRTPGLLVNGYVHVHDTDEWIPILGTPDDESVQEPLERKQVTRVPYGARIDLVAYGHDTQLGRPGVWQSQEHYVWGPLEGGQFTITLGDR